MFNKLIEFLKEVRAEIDKISWPTRPELVESTFVVIVSVIAISVFIGLVDVAFSKLLEFFATAV